MITSRKLNILIHASTYLSMSCILDCTAFSSSLSKIGRSLSVRVSLMNASTKLFLSICKDLYTFARILKYNIKIHLSRNMRCPTMWYVRLAKPLISLCIREVWSEPLLVAWVFLYCMTASSSLSKTGWNSSVRVLLIKASMKLSLSFCNDL